MFVPRDTVFTHVKEFAAMICSSWIVELGIGKIKNTCEASSTGKVCNTEMWHSLVSSPLAVDHDKVIPTITPEHKQEARKKIEALHRTTWILRKQS